MASLKNICELLAGGFLSENAPCIVSIKTSDSSYNNMVAVNAIGHDKNPSDLMNELSNLISVDTSNIQVEVYSMYGMIDGSKIPSL